jgi:hypothetical protein
MKFTRLAVLFVLLLSLVPLTASAQTVSYDSGIQVQNQGTDVATIVITYYNQDGTVATTVDDTIAVDSSNTYFPIDGLTAGFSGSAVISSDQPVVAISNMLLTESGGTTYGFGGASYGGFESGASSASLPLIMKGNANYSTWFNVQNTGSADTTVTVTYSNGATEGATIPAGAAYTFVQDDNGDLPDGFVGSATVDGGGQPIAASVVELGPTTVFAYNGFTGGSTEVVMPLVNANNYGYVTGIQIQNAGDTDTDVTVAYTPSSSGTACTEQRTIAAGASATFALYVFTYSGSAPLAEDCVMGEQFVGSAAVSANSADQPLVAIVNQLHPSNNKGASYGGFDPAAGTDAVAMPLIMDRNYGYFTGFSVMNVGSADTTVTCTYTDNAHTDVATLAPGEALAPVQLNVLADTYVGSATCTASDGGSIVGIVNELNSSSAGDAFLVYEGFNQ